MHAPPKPNYPVISVGQLTDFDAYLFGIPTRYGNFPGQWKVRPYARSVVAPAIRRLILSCSPSTGLLGRNGRSLGER